MSYARFLDSNWYIYWHYDGVSPRKRENEILSITPNGRIHCKAQYFTYSGIKDLIEQSHKYDFKGFTAIDGTKEFPNDEQFLRYIFDEWVRDVDGEYSRIKRVIHWIDKKFG